ncbi:MAG: hypothetical protein RIC55_16255 [Pirellulaceae bacterium]
MPESQTTWWQWLLWLIGIDAGGVSDEYQRSANNLPQSGWLIVAIVALLLLLAGVVFLYLKESKTCPRPVRLLLGGLRCGVLLILALILIEPVLIYTQTRTREATVVVARDASQSMQWRDRYLDEQAAQGVARIMGRPADELTDRSRGDRPTRADVLNQLLSANNFELLKQLQHRGKVQIVDFSDRVVEVETRPALRDQATRDQAMGEMAADSGSSSAAEITPASHSPTLPPLNAEGRGSDLWLAVKEMLAVNPLSSIVIFTDGQHTGSEDPLEVADEAAAKDVRLFIVGLGDPSRPRNLRVSNVYVRPEVWPDEPFEIEAVLSAQGIAGRTVQLDLIEQTVAEGGQAGADRVVQRSEVLIPAEGGLVRTTFSHTAAQPGRYLYSVRAEQIADESDEDDNRLASTPVEVLDRRKIRVLLIAGAPSWEYQLVERLLERDESISVSAWMQTLDRDRQQAGDVPIDHLPATLQELNEYHVVMLFDPNPEEFDEAWIDMLKDFAEKQSGGVLYLAGPKYTGMFLTGRRTSKLRDILPVRLGDLGEVTIANLTTTNRQQWPLRVTPYNIDHPIMSFYQDRQASLARWQELPGVYWSFPVLGPKPTAKVLLEHSDHTLRDAPRPLLVVGRAGSANTVYVGFNGTWRWRRAGRQAEFFDRFWIQTVRFLVESRSLKGRRRGYIQTDRDYYEIGDRIHVTAQLQDASFQPLALPEVHASLAVGDEPPRGIVLKQVANQPGEYETNVTARRTGQHVLRVVDLPDTAGPEAVRIESSYRVDLPTVEQNQLWLNKPLLVEMARRSGGKYFELDQLDQLAEQVPDASETFEVRGRPEMLWSTSLGGLSTGGLLLGCLVVLLGAEWGVRKGFKLL